VVHKGTLIPVGRLRLRFVLVSPGSCRALKLRFTMIATALLRAALDATDIAKLLT
jgi:hypothetical protein